MKFAEFLTTDLTTEQRKVIYMVGWRGLLLLHVAWACGFLAPIGLQGFAWSGDVKSVEVRVTDIQIDMLEQRIFYTRVSQCTADSAEARLFYGQTLQGLLRRYQDVTRSSYPLPSCEEVR